MSARGPRTTGSRFLYEPFDATTARIDAHERITEERWMNLERRLLVIEGLLDRMERRLWLVVFGVAAFLAGEVAVSLLSTTQ
ncbi:GTA head formation protein, RCAP_rcc01685 family [Halovulum sp. GXIMD14794]